MMGGGEGANSDPRVEVPGFFEFKGGGHMTIFYCILARVARPQTLENDPQHPQKSNFFFACGGLSSFSSLIMLLDPSNNIV